MNMHSYIRTALLTVLLALPAIAQENGQFDVPENRSNPNSRSITIKYQRFPSTAKKPGYPIVYLAGGPGGSGIGSLQGTRRAIVEAFREYGDVIAYDQRGTNKSGPKMTCDESYAADPSKPLDRTAINAMIQALKPCVDKLRAEGVDIAGYNTRENAADLEDLRKHLGAEKLILWGISYGAHMGIAALRDNGAHIDRVILAGIEGPDDTYKLPSDQQTLLEEIGRRAPGDLLASIRNILRELERSPKKVTLTHPTTGQSTELVLGPLDLQVEVADRLFAPENFSTLPDFITRIERGDWTALALAAATMRFGSTRSVMSVAMDCASGISASRKAVIADEASRTLLGDAVNIPFPEICAAVNVPDLGDAFRSPLRSNVPALLISGTLDGRTRPRQAEEFRRFMPNAQHLVIEGAGHSDPLFLSSPKILEAMKAFLRGEPLRERVVAAAPFTFVPVRNVASVSDEVLSRYVGSYRFPENVVRRVVKAGAVLYMIREGQSPFVMRPLSETEFFFEAGAITIRFEKDAMVFRMANGEEMRGVRE
jgi:pimeloyl-ACP methyl ester carboxylesterase